MCTIKIEDIIIPQVFSDSTPQEWKIDKIVDYILKNHKLDKPLVLKDKVLVDNYIRYIAAKKLNMEEVEYVSVQEYKRLYPQTDMPITYITGVFVKNGKEYTWKNSKEIPLSVGDRVLVFSNDTLNHKNKSIVTVSKIFQSNKPSMLRHKTVIKNLTKNEVKKAV